MSRVYKANFVDRADAVDEAELRIYLAAAYRLAARYKLDDLIYSNITARLPGTEGWFLIAPHGLMFDEITASSLAKVDYDGNVIAPGSMPDLPVSRFGCLLHGGLFAARPDINCSMHMHTQAGVAVSILECGLLATNHLHYVLIGERLAYHDYEGDFSRFDERERLVQHLGQDSVMILRNHGLVTVGSTVAAAFHRMFYLEFLCRVQLDAMSTGRALTIPDEEVRRRTAQVFESQPTPISGYEWSALLRVLDRTDPSFRD